MNRSIWGSSSLLSLCKHLTMVVLSLNDLGQATFESLEDEVAAFDCFYILHNPLDTAYHTIIITADFNL